MPVISVTKSWEGREQRRGDEITRMDGYFVLTDDSESGDVRNEIEEHEEIPQFGASPEDRDDIYVRDVAIHERGGPNTWEVIVAYSSRANVFAVTDQPELEPPSVEYSTISTEELLQADADGVPVANSAEQPFDPGVTRNKVESVLIFSRNYTECTVTPEFVRSFTDVVNDDECAFGARGEVRIVGAPVPVWNPRRGSTPGYWRVSFTLLVRKNPSGAGVPDYAAHFRQLLDHGVKQLVEAEPEGARKYLEARTVSGASAGGMYLDGHGKELPVGSPFVWLYFREFPEADFDPLGLVWPYCDGEASMSESDS